MDTSTDPPLGICPASLTRSNEPSILLLSSSHLDVNHTPQQQHLLSLPSFAPRFLLFGSAAPVCTTDFGAPGWTQQPLVRLWTRPLAGHPGFHVV